MKTILECVVGSQLYGTNVGVSDTDLIAVGVEEPSKILGFSPKDTIVERDRPDGEKSQPGDVERTTYGLRKFLNLALKGNPTILLPLFAPEEMCPVLTECGRMLRQLAPHIVSKQVYYPFRGYMESQHKRLKGELGQKRCTRPDLVEAHGYDTKYAAHIVRLGFQGLELMMTGRITLPMKQTERELVTDVRLGRATLEEVSEGIEILEQALEASFETSPLPLQPDYQLVEDWMLETYRWHWRQA